MNNNNRTIDDYGLSQLELEEAAFTTVENTPPFSFYPDNIDKFSIEDVYRAVNIKSEKCYYFLSN